MSELKMEVWEYLEGCVFVARLQSGTVAEYFRYDDKQFKHRLKLHFERCTTLQRESR